MLTTEIKHFGNLTNKWIIGLMEIDKINIDIIIDLTYLEILLRL